MRSIRCFGRDESWDLDYFYGMVMCRGYEVAACRARLSSVAARALISLNVRNDPEEHEHLEGLLAAADRLSAYDRIWSLTFGLSRFCLWNEATKLTIATLVLDDALVGRHGCRPLANGTLDIKSGKYPHPHLFSQFETPHEVGRWAEQQVALSYRALRVASPPAQRVQLREAEAELAVRTTQGIVLNRLDQRSAALYEYVFGLVGQLLADPEPFLVKHLTIEALHLYFDEGHILELEVAKRTTG
ncbi:MAG TPA: hypothetical protein VF711_09380, partial [Acidimicrobiales bacterium]